MTEPVYQIGIRANCHLTPQRKPIQIIPFFVFFVFFVVIRGNSTVTAPTKTLSIFVFVPTQAFENRRGTFQNGGYDVAAFLGVSEAAPSDCLHPVKGDHNFSSQRTVLRVDCLKDILSPLQA